MPPHSMDPVDQRDMVQLKEWLGKQPHLPDVPDKILARMLHSCYGSVERTKTTVDNYFTITTHASELFANHVFDQRYKDAMKVVYVLPLPERTREGYSVILFRFQDADPTKFDMPAVVHASITAFFTLAEEEDRMPGYVALFDFTGVTMGHIMRISITVLKQLLIFVQDALPVRLKGIHFIFSSPLVQQIVNMVKPLMKPELLEIFHVYKTEEMPKFYEKVLPHSALPEEDGGKGGTYSSLHSAMEKRIEANAPYLRALDGLVVDEKRRAGRAKSSSDVFGIQGSFKKLDLD